MEASKPSTSHKTGSGSVGNINECHHHCATHVDLVQLTQEWTIHNFQSLVKLCKPGQCLRSSPFHHKAYDDVNWQLCMYPGGKRDENKGFISLFLKMYAPPIKDVCVTAEYRLYFIHEGGESRFSNVNIGEFHSRSGKKGFGWGLRNLPRQKVLSCVRSDGSLHIHCEVDLLPDLSKLQCVENKGADLSSANIPRTIAVPSRYMDCMVELFETGNLSDFNIEVRGGKTFKVHKAILAAHSVVFSAMFDSTMMEATNNTMKIIDFSAVAVEEMLRYIYGCTPPRSALVTPCGSAREDTPFSTSPLSVSSVNNEKGRNKDNRNNNNNNNKDNTSNNNSNDIDNTNNDNGGGDEQECPASVISLHPDEPSKDATAAPSGDQGKRCPSPSVADPPCSDSTTSLEHLLGLAEKYSLASLKTTVCKSLAERLTIDSVCQSLAVADMYAAAELKAACVSFIIRHKASVLAGDPWVELRSRSPLLVNEVLEALVVGSTGRVCGLAGGVHSAASGAAEQLAALGSLGAHSANASGISSWLGIPEFNHFLRPATPSGGAGGDAAQFGAGRSPSSSPGPSVIVVGNPDQLGFHPAPAAQQPANNQAGPSGSGGQKRPRYPRYPSFDDIDRLRFPDGGGDNDGPGPSKRNRAN